MVSTLKLKKYLMDRIERENARRMADNAPPTGLMKTLTSNAVMKALSYAILFGAFINLAWSGLVVMWVTKCMTCTPDVSELDPEWMESVDFFMTGFLRLTSLGIHGFFIGGDFMRLSDYKFSSDQTCYSSYFHLHMFDMLKMMCCYIWWITSVKYVMAIHTKQEKGMRRMVSLNILRILLQVVTTIMPMHVAPKLIAQDITVTFRVMQYIDIFISVCVLIVMMSHANQYEGKRKLISFERNIIFNGKTAAPKPPIISLNKLNEMTFKCPVNCKMDDTV